MSRAISIASVKEKALAGDKSASAYYKPLNGEWDFKYCPIISIRTFFRKATQKTRREIEQLVAGECVTKKIIQELTYREQYEKIDNVWSVMFTTGYLTQRGKTEEGSTGIVIKVKYAEEGDADDLEEGCREALEQIEKMGYEERLRQDGAESIVRYGIAFHRKKCRVRTEHG